MIFTIAWKNVWRSKARSLVVVLAISIGLWGGITAVAFMNGLLMGRLNDAIKIEVSSVQLHNAAFMENDEIQYTIKGVDELMAQMVNYKGVEAVSKRFRTDAMITSNRSAAGATIIGIVPEQEKKISELYQHLVDSNSHYFEGIKRRPILIGQKMADKLKVHVRSKMMINTVDTDGNAVREVFRVVGIFKTQNAMFDEMNVFIRFSDAKIIFNLKDDEAHEVAILMDDMMETSEITNYLKNKYTSYQIDEKALLKARNDSIPDLMYKELESLKSTKEYTFESYEKVLSHKLGAETYQEYKKQLSALSETGLNISEWKYISPELAMQSTWLDFMLYIFVGIILAALGFGIVNTMLMAVLERIRELGMLIAIGMNRRRVFSMIVLETVFLSLTGGFVGIIISWITIKIMHTTGVNMSQFSDGMQALGYPTLIYPSVDFASYVSITIMVILTGILAAIYPALHAIRLKPAEAIRKE
ncbi:MAG: ABC transporter permease [Bacteroidales bacterium]|nr:ABC transporter permease [Bacteroidales bacterium]